MYFYSNVSGVCTINIRYDDGINLIYCTTTAGLLTIVVELVSDKLTKVVIPVMVVTPTMFGVSHFL